MNIPPDLFLYFIIAAGVVFWLKNTLGTKHGEERQRDNPLNRLPDEPASEQDADNPVEGFGETSTAPRKRSEKSVFDLAKPYTLPKNREQGVSQRESKGRSGDMFAQLPSHIEITEESKPVLTRIIQESDGLDLLTFVRAAEDAYAIIIEAYAEGDLETLESLLGTTLFVDFREAVLERQADGRKFVMQIEAITKTVITAVELQGSEASVTIDFHAKTLMYEKDQAGEISSGRDDRPVTVTDEWVFSRNLRSTEPTWRLIATHDIVG